MLGIYLPEHGPMEPVHILAPQPAAQLGRGRLCSWSCCSLEFGGCRAGWREGRGELVSQPSTPEGNAWEQTPESVLNHTDTAQGGRELCPQHGSAVLSRKCMCAGLQTRTLLTFASGPSKL